MKQLIWQNVYNTLAARLNWLRHSRRYLSRQTRLTASRRRPRPARTGIWYAQADVESSESATGAETATQETGVETPAGQTRLTASRRRPRPARTGIWYAQPGVESSESATGVKIGTLEAGVETPAPAASGQTRWGARRATTWGALRRQNFYATIQCTECLEDRTLLSATNPLDLATLNGTTGFRLDGIDASDYSGVSVSSAGDVNGDGFDDLIIGAYRAVAESRPSLRFT